MSYFQGYINNTNEFLCTHPAVERAFYSGQLSADPASIVAEVVLNLLMKDGSLIKSSGYDLLNYGLAEAELDDILKDVTE